MQLLPFNPESPWWQDGTELFVVDAEAFGLARDADFVELDVDELPATVIVEQVRPGPKGRLVVRLRGVRDRSGADDLRGCLLAAPADVLGDLEDGEFWYHELEGWEVEDHGGRGVIGRVVRVVAAHTELLEVRPLGGGPTWFIPIVDAFVKELDRDGRRVLVELIEGLEP